MLEDTQNRKDNRKINIDKVGIKDIKYPIILRDKKNIYQNTIADISMSVKLSHNFKGTHMSRFIEILDRYKDNINFDTIDRILDEMRHILSSEESHISLTFPYFIKKETPVSKKYSLMDYLCTISGMGSNQRNEYILTVKVPIHSLCPCSKEVSSHGAHNQRSILKISIIEDDKKLIWFDDLISIAESSGSSPIYSLLKREDEKYITEQAYNNPVFVEDIVRNATEQLMNDERIKKFEIECENMESIHNHNAWAMLGRSK